jgi:hypothetical protein
MLATAMIYALTPEPPWISPLNTVYKTRKSRLARKNTVNIVPRVELIS